MRLVCISDTHGFHRKLEIPPGDVLIHSGDITGNGEIGIINDFNRWLGDLPHPWKIVIAGNHDRSLQAMNSTQVADLFTNAIYLQDSGVEIDGIRFWGSPWTPEFFSWAFMLGRGEAIAKRWDLIPDDIDVLITHGPPKGILDGVPNAMYAGGKRFFPDYLPLQHVGCEELWKAVQRVNPTFHIFGHIHEAYGQQLLGGVHYVNASTCDARYYPINKATVLEYE